MAVVFSASTRLGSPENTSYFFRPLMHWLFPGMSEEKIEQIHFVVRKTAHFVEYAVLGVLAWRAVHFEPACEGYSAGRQLRLALMLCMLYAATDEFHQSFVPSRQPAVQDVLLDSCGSGFSLVAIWGARQRRGAR